MKALSAVMIGVLLIGLFLAQSFVEADNCCKDYNAKKCFLGCLDEDNSREFCANWCGCKCTSGIFLNCGTTLQTANHLCKLGCASSVCSNIIALYESAAPCELCIKQKTELKKTLNQVAGRCNDACFKVCNMKSDAVVVAAN
ncbi:hypothetical protein MKX01_035557 [Papaver californicum]|nr:hypothetical protein MKX01_035557 [Papaver californicum]